MSLPPEVLTCILSAGSANDLFDGTGVTTLAVTPNFGGGVEIIWGATGDSYIVTTKNATSASGGSASVAVPYVNQSGFLDSHAQATSMWSYDCVITKTVAGVTKTTKKSVQPLIGQPVVDLDEVADGVSTPPVSAPFPQVISVNGQTGIVVIPGGGGGGGVSDVNGRTGSVTLAKADVGLANVNNTTDAAKPISTATQNALNAKADDTQVVKKSGAQSVGGPLGFTVSPTGPDPTTPQQLATMQFVLDNAGSVPDADASTKGKLRLTGALGGTADAPTTPTAVHLAGTETVSGDKTFTGTETFTGPTIVPTPLTSQPTRAANVAFVLANGGTPADASPTVKGIVQLTNHLAGTATAPTVPGLALKLAISNNLSEIAAAGGAAQVAAGKNIGILDVSGLIFIDLVPDFSASKIVSGSLNPDYGAVNSGIRIKKGVSTYPARPSRSTNYYVEWEGDTPPPEDSTHAISDCDYWLEDAS